MKRVVEPDEISGFDAMLGESIVVLCGVYIYAGVLSGVNDDHIELSQAVLVYDTGEWSAETWADAQPLRSPHRVMKHGIESWGPGKC